MPEGDYVAHRPTVEALRLPQVGTPIACLNKFHNSFHTTHEPNRKVSSPFKYKLKFYIQWA